MKRALAAAAAGILLALAGAARADPVQPPPLFVPVTIATDDGIVPAALDWNSIDVLFKESSSEHKIGTPDAPQLAFTSGDPYRLQVELFFDTYEQGTSVRELTDKIEKLAFVVPEARRPPVALVTWGTGLAFKCILESFSLRFTLFLEDGTPVRAVMDTVWKEFTPAEDEVRGNPRH